ncbi:MAG: tol-pal system-associated acyl-CoA thioesterase [Proteobacteria bacterium]|nr:tol-pal system-associated acyl-CoA thioesterase [Pseudomonadota bacterium]
MQDSLLFTFPVRVYYEDTDTANVVYHANYFKYSERARTEMLRDLGIEQETLRQLSGIVFVVRRCEADFLQPARLDDSLIVTTTIDSITGASILFYQEINKSAIILAKLRTQVACVDKQGRVQRLPPLVRVRMAPLSYRCKPFV